MTLNPPTPVEGQSIVQFFPPWLFEEHPNSPQSIAKGRIESGHVRLAFAAHDSRTAPDPGAYELPLAHQL